MRPFRTTLLAILALALAAPVTAMARDGARVGTKPESSKKERGSFLEKPIEPAPEREAKPRGGWNGFYGGLNGGSTASDR